MLWVYGHYNFFILLVRRPILDVYRRQILTSRVNPSPPPPSDHGRDACPAHSPRCPIGIWVHFPRCKRVPCWPGAVALTARVLDQFMFISVRISNTIVHQQPHFHVHVVL